MENTAFADITLKEIQEKLMGQSVPPTFQNLRQFTEWWLKNKCFNTPHGSKIYISDDAYSFPIFKKDNYQVELYIINNHKGGVYSHSHPGVELVQIRLLDDDSPVSGFGQTDYLADGSFHGVPGSNGDMVVKLVFLVFERWPDGVDPTSVAVQFRGKTAGPLQAEMISSHYPGRVDEFGYSYVREEDLLKKVKS